MPKFTVRLARIGWIVGSIEVEAATREDAMVRAKADSDQAFWPIDEDGDDVTGFGPVEVAQLFTEDGDALDGEDTDASNATYVAAPDMYRALKALEASGLLETLEAMDSAMADDGDDPVAKPHVEAIRAAIAKAEI